MSFLKNSVFQGVYPFHLHCQPFGIKLSKISPIIPLICVGFVGIFFLSFFILVICIFSLFFSLFSLTKGLSILLVFSENHLRACVLSIVFLFYSFPLFIVPSIYLEFSFTSFLEWRLGSLILGLSQFLILLLLFSHSVWLFATLWMASPTQWTWVWVDSRSWWWTVKPGMLQSMGSQRVRHDWATKQQHIIIPIQRMI